MFATTKFIVLGAAVGYAVLLLAAGCTSDAGGGSSCFSPAHGPTSTSCAGYAIGLACPVDLQPWYSCVCTDVPNLDAGADAMTPLWVCMPSGSGSGSSSGSSSGGTGGAGGTSSSSTSSTSGSSSRSASTSSSGGDAGLEGG